MADEGNFKLWRRFFDHPYWLEKRVYNRAEAWIDVIAMASFRDREVMIGSTKIELKRGEFMASIRYLETRWSWGRHKVYNFIRGAIERGELAYAKSTQKGDTYRVVNYDRYQDGGDSEGTARGQRRSKGSKEESSTSVLPKKRRTQKRGAEHPLPPDWLPTDSHREQCKELGVDCEQQARRFRDHAEATGRTLVSWNAGFRVWLGNAKRFTNGKNAPPDDHDAFIEKTTKELI